MSLKDDLIAAKGRVAHGSALLQAVDEVTGDDVADAKISQRSLALVDALNSVRPKRPGRGRPTLRDMHEANVRDDLLAMFDRAMEAQRP